MLISFSVGQWPLLSPEDAKAPRPRLGLKSRKFKRQLRIPNLASPWSGLEHLVIDLVGSWLLGFPQRAIQKRPKPNLPAVLLMN